jgi:hypothetical protein
MTTAYHILEGRIEPSGAGDAFFIIDDAIPGSLVEAQNAAHDYLCDHHRPNAKLTWLKGSNNMWYARDLAITFRIRPQ